MLNSVNIIGRLVKDAEVKGKGEKEVTTFSIANERKSKDKVEVSYFDCTHFTKGSSVKKYLTKGQQVAISGRLVQDSWKGKDGKTKYQIKINVITLDLIGSKPKEESEEDDSDDEMPF